MELILLIDHKTAGGKVTFGVVKNCKISKYPERNCKMAWDGMVVKYAPKTTPSLLVLKKEFENSKLKNVKKDPED